MLVNAIRACEEGETIRNTEEILMAHITNGIIHVFHGELIYCLCVMLLLICLCNSCKGVFGKSVGGKCFYLSSLRDDGMDFCLDVSAGGKDFHAV